MSRRVERKGYKAGALVAGMNAIRGMGFKCVLCAAQAWFGRVARVLLLGIRPPPPCALSQTLDPCALAQTLDPGPWTLDPGPWTLDPGPLTLTSDPRSSGPPPFPHLLPRPLPPPLTPSLAYPPDHHTSQGPSTPGCPSTRTATALEQSTKHEARNLATVTENHLTIHLAEHLST